MSENNNIVMVEKKALIVDDSKLALFVLKKMLVEIGLEVDTAQSGEEALGYLAHKRPDVIFLDHTMPGMDGLQVLKIVKENTDLAMIPVMMYTSKEDHGYIAEARSLGAVDILPKQLKPSELRHALNTVDLLPVEIEQEALNDDIPAHQMRADSSLVRSPDLTYEAEKEELSGLLRDAESALEKESLKQFIDQELERYFLKYRGLVRQATKRLDSTLSSAVGNDSVYASVRRIGTSLVLIFVAVFVVYAHLDLRSDMGTLQDFALASADAQGIVINVEGGSLPEEESNDADIDGILDALAQAANELGEVAYGQAFASEQVAQQVADWLLPLNWANYDGELQIQFSTGRFCVVSSSEGRFGLPDPATLFSDCQVVDYSFDQESDELAVFQRFMKEINSDKNNRFSIFTVRLEPGQERVSYPAQESTLTAGEWNAAAQKNHRIDYVFR